MRTSTQIRTAPSQHTGERGSLLIETLIAMIVLAIGLGGLFSLLAASMYTNNRSGADTRSTMLGEHVIEQISAQQANSASTATLTITDCAGTAWTINTWGSAKGAGSGGSYGGNGANLTSAGIIDWTQSYSSVASNYKMKYVDCGAGGRQTTYDVRWDVISFPSTYTRMIFASARPLGNQSIHDLRFITPANLRTIGGM
jgi:type II secretory pathway pseudopilin PulG